MGKNYRKIREKQAFIPLLRLEMDGKKAKAEKDTLFRPKRTDGF